MTFSYRLGALGFLDVPGENPTGALGLHDQVAALRWTRQNIAAFGGDPGQITVYGLTAGDPGWTRYEPGAGRQAMIFGGDAPRLAADPFSFARATWAGLHWQPGTWWAVDGVS